VLLLEGAHGSLTGGVITKTDFRDVRAVFLPVIDPTHDNLRRLLWTAVSCQDRRSDPHGYLQFHLDSSARQRAARPRAFKRTQGIEADDPMSIEKVQLEAA
jgi:hypothetical protein